MQIVAPITKAISTLPAYQLGKIALEKPQVIAVSKLPVAGYIDIAEEFVTQHQTIFQEIVERLAPKLGLASLEQLNSAQQPIKSMLKSQVKSAQKALMNNGLQCGGAFAGFATIRWGIPLLNEVFKAGIELSPEFSLMARVVPISIFMNSLFRILENRRTLFAAQKNLQKLQLKLIR